MNVTEITAKSKEENKIIRLAAYCRVSSDSADQLHSFAAQIRYYKDYEQKHPEYKLVDIYADEGLTGTSMEKRDELNRLIRDCKKGKIDRIVVKSVSRFARNTQELLVCIRLLKELGISVYFEEQGIDTDKLNMEMIVTFPGMAAQQESESISGNMRWSYKKRMESGEFNCCNPAYGYILKDGQLMINEPQAAIIRRIFDLYLSGVGKQSIANILNDEGVSRRYGKDKWYESTVHYILNNERYMGDALLQKSYTTETLPFKRKMNHGELPKYYVENSHPAIIDSATFGRAQEELARRSGKRKISRKAKTEQGKYSSKYALTELLVCGECKSAYRRCTWTASGKKKIVWRCINRIEYAKKYCHNSPSVEESVLQRAVMAAIMETANQNAEVLRTLKLHIGMGLAGEKSVDNSIDLQIRIAEIDAEFKKMLDRVSTDTIEAFDEETATRLMNEKNRLQQQLDSIADAEQRRENAKSRLDDIYTILDGIKNRPMEYDDQIVRQLLECVVVDSKEQITIIFKGGLKSVQPLTE